MYCGEGELYINLKTHAALFCAFRLDCAGVRSFSSLLSRRPSPFDDGSSASPFSLMLCPMPLMLLSLVVRLGNIDGVEAAVADRGGDTSE